MSRYLESGMRSDYLRVNRLNPTWETPWYAEAFQFREWCDEGYYEITDEGRLVKLFRPCKWDENDCTVNLHADGVDLREDMNHNGIIEFWGEMHRRPGGYDIDTYQAQFLNGQLIAIWRKGVFGDIVTTQAEYEAWEKSRAAWRAMTPEQRVEAQERALASRKQAVEAAVDAVLAMANRPGFMRRFLARVDK